MVVTDDLKKVGRTTKKGNTLVEIKDVIFGNGTPVLIAGPCAIESEDQFRTIAKGVKKAGAHMLRGGAFKPRTSPYSFQGLGIEGLKIMNKIGNELNLPIVTEIMSTDDLDIFEELVDMIQIGSRNMQNFDLLKKVGRLKKPILLKRSFASTIEEFLLAAEYILKEDNEQVVLCERGIRTFEPKMQCTLDLDGLIEIKKMTHLPIIADPSHAAMQNKKVVPLAKAALRAKADGLIIEVHHKPDEALSDGEQALTIENFKEMMNELKKMQLLN